MIKKIDCTLRSLLVVLITLYQKLLSPDHSFWAPYINQYGYCRYYPTCSNYTKEALSIFSLPQAFPHIFKRLLSCHPWAQGGFDALPKKTERQSL